VALPPVRFHAAGGVSLALLLAGFLTFFFALSQPSLALPDGASLFKANCAACHGAQGQGGGIGPSMHADAFPALIEARAVVAGGGMPSFAAVLKPDEITAVATYIAEQIADPAARQATAGEGGQVYRLYCAGCHSATGRGGALSQTPNAPSYTGRPAANALAAMLRGPKNMPVFSGTLSVRQQAAVALYVQVLKHPPSPGGLGLAYLGPVLEGLASFVGLLVLVLISVWLGWGKGRERA
jgi:ubiquinol-cytochrome c reductase cytochrome c subunit